MSDGGPAPTLLLDALAEPAALLESGTLRVLHANRALLAVEPDAVGALPPFAWWTGDPADAVAAEVAAHDGLPAAKLAIFRDNRVALDRALRAGGDRGRRERRARRGVRARRARHARAARGRLRRRRALRGPDARPRDGPGRRGHADAPLHAARREHRRRDRAHGPAVLRRGLRGARERGRAAARRRWASAAGSPPVYVRDPHLAETPCLVEAAACGARSSPATAARGTSPPRPPPGCPSSAA